MMVLPKTALLPDLVPAIRLKAREQFLYFRWHTVGMVCRRYAAGFERSEQISSHPLARFPIPGDP